MKIFKKIFNRIFILPVMPLVIIYAIYSFYRFYKDGGIEFHMMIEKDEDIGEAMRNSEYERFTKTYVTPVFHIIAIIAWFYIIKYMIYG